MTIISSSNSTYSPIDNDDSAASSRLAGFQTNERRSTGRDYDSATSAADNWFSSAVENSSFVKAVLPQEYKLNKFQLMEGINSPLPESIQHGSNGLKYRVHSKSNRYNT